MGEELFDGMKGQTMGIILCARPSWALRRIDVRLAARDRPGRRQDETP